MPIESGRTGTAECVVSAAVTAIALGSGDVPVLGTPALLALIEEACCNAVRGEIPEGSTSVGTWAEIEHLAPSKIGVTVIATATLREATERTLSFTCEVYEGAKLIGRASHRRAIVLREPFLG